jgi:hypothetical protein
MKKILFFSLIIACLFSFGKCNKKKCTKKKASTETSASRLNANEVWMQYDETKCANPWQFNWFQKPTQAQILGAIKSDLLGKEIVALELRSSTEKDFISCDACDCPNGTHYYVRVNKTEIEKLKALKFFEVKDAPKMDSVDTAK